MENNNQRYHTIFEIEAGWIGLTGSSQGLSRITLPQGSRELAGLSLGESVRQSIDSPDYFKKIIEEFKAYFSGSQVKFSAELDFSEATEFERDVWNTTRRIPYGETRSYRWVAVQIGKPLAPRAVGQALGRNYFPIIIPCHRVLTSSGKLGGFGGGLSMKRYLLELEAGVRALNA